MERTTQLNEITSQVQVNLENALDAHWNYVTIAVNILEEQEFDTLEDVTECLRRMEELMEAESYSSELMLLDSQGNCYDARGKHGVWSDIQMISGGEERYTFISDSLSGRGSYWAFVRKAVRPFQAEAEGISFTHVILLKDVHALAEYYDSAAYGSRNETYILKSNGTRMHDDIYQDKTIQAYNVLKVLEEM